MNSDDLSTRPSETAASPSPSAEKAKYEARIKALEILLDDAQTKARARAKLERSLLDAEAELVAMKNSTSWRITTPVRSLGRLVLAVRMGKQTLQRQAAHRGGYARALAYYFEVLQREGRPGIRARLNRVRAGVGFADGPPSDEVYADWIEKYDTIGPSETEKLQGLLTSLTATPLISIVVPTYNSDAVFLKEMLDSVRGQIYPHWELCIADDASPDRRIVALLEEAMQSDPRIKVVFRPDNGHISEASNSALALATGTYVALLDHDDIIPPHALLMAVKYINEHPQGRMFYSDEDKLTEKGNRTAPYFKSDWNPEMFLTQNLFSHLGIFETNLVREVGGFRKGFEGSQDYDLTLRCVEVAGNDAVVHIPHVLYHWRISPGSTAASGSEKPYALLAAIRALEEHFSRMNIEASIEQPVASLGILRVRYALPEVRPLISIIIPTRDGVDLLRQCIGSLIAKTLYKDYEIIIIDNGSEKPETLAYFAELSKLERVRVITDNSPFNFSALNNRAVSLATGEFVCLLNNDIEIISPSWLDELVALGCQPGNGAVGACLWYPNDALQHGGVLIGLGGVAGHMHHMLKRGQFGYFARAVVSQNLSAVTAACLLIRKSIYEVVGGFDEKLAVAFNDVDFCLRVREAGYRNVWTPYAELYHHESATRGSDMNPEHYARFSAEVEKMQNQWHTHLDRDPAYNPNLSLSTKVLPFTLASPPRIGQFQ